MPLKSVKPINHTEWPLDTDQTVNEWRPFLLSSINTVVVISSQDERIQPTKEWVTFKSLSIGYRLSFRGGAEGFAAHE